MGENIIEQSLYLIHIFDWLSVFKADKKNIDVVEVDVIDYLKFELAK
ncbi:MAG: SIS domain-containing protein [Flavobacteriales bacterium]